MKCRWSGRVREGKGMRRQGRKVHSRSLIVKCRNFSRAFCTAVHFSSLSIYKFMACIRTICVHMALNKSRLCARVRVPIMNMYGSFCGRYVRVLFTPCDSCVRARSKDAAHLPFSLHSPPPPPCRTHVHFPSPFSLSFSFALSFFSSLFIPAYVDYATISFVSHPTAVSFLTATVRNVYQQMRQ